MFLNLYGLYTIKGSQGNDWANSRSWSSKHWPAPPHKLALHFRFQLFHHFIRELSELYHWIFFLFISFSAVAMLITPLHWNCILDSVLWNLTQYPQMIFNLGFKGIFKIQWLLLLYSILCFTHGHYCKWLWLQPCSLVLIIPTSKKVTGMWKWMNDDLLTCHCFGTLWILIGQLILSLSGICRDLIKMLFCLYNKCLLYVINMCHSNLLTSWLFGINEKWSLHWRSLILCHYGAI